MAEQKPHSKAVNRRVVVTAFGYPPAYLGSTGTAMWETTEQDGSTMLQIKLDHRPDEIVPLRPEHVEEEGEPWKP